MQNIFNIEYCTCNFIFILDIVDDLLFAIHACLKLSCCQVVCSVPISSKL